MVSPAEAYTEIMRGAGQITIPPYSRLVILYIYTITHISRKTSAELKLLEVNRERKVLENEERNFLIQKEHSQRKLEVLQK